MNIMKSLQALVFLLGIGISLTAYSLGNDPYAQAVMIKQYVDPQSIVFSDNKIFVPVNGELMQTNALFSDVGGVYAIVDTGWVCEKCRRKNTDNPWSCIFCGASRGGRD